jgi:6-phosphogluconolactonase
MQHISTLPENYDGGTTTAAVRVAPSGRFVYGSNRGHDSIVVFAVDPDTGHLSYVEHTSTQGRTPRDFNIDPTGSFLLAANQASDTIVTFRIDPATGRLTPTGHTAAVVMPVCIAFAAA